MVLLKVLTAGKKGSCRKTVKQGRMKKMGLKLELTSEGYIGLAIVYDAAASKFPVHTTRKLNIFFHIILSLKSKNRNWIFNFSDYWSRGFKRETNKYTWKN